MIKANELRIGNWVINDGDDKMFVLDGEDIFTASKDEDWLLPIPLTPEIFERFGFDREGSDMCKILNKNMDYAFKISFTGRGYHSINAVINYPIMFVHQLQNLYYSLTGEELTLK